MQKNVSKKEKKEKKVAQGARPTEASKLIKQLEKVGVPLTAVVEKLGVNWYTAYRWSRGHHNPHPGTLARLKALLPAEKPA